jgi:hypothetical protein
MVPPQGNYPLCYIKGLRPNYMLKRPGILFFKILPANNISVDHRIDPDQQYKRLHTCT